MSNSATSSHNISHAERHFRGDVYYAGYANQWAGRAGRRGVLMPALSFVDFGAVATLDDDNIIDAATSTEVPNTETVTYTVADDGTTPVDNAGRVSNTTIQYQGASVAVWVLDVPRNMISLVTHASSVVAMTITITGYDEYLEKVVETITVAATGTSQSDSGLKAFKYIESIALTAAADAEANTVNVGFGDVLGLPFRLDNANSIIAANADGSVEDATIVTAVTTDPATAITGDIRGTVDFTTASDATVRFGLLMALAETRTKAGVFGVAQFGG